MQLPPVPSNLELLAALTAQGGNFSVLLGDDGACLAGKFYPRRRDARCFSGRRCPRTFQQARLASAIMGIWRGALPAPSLFSDPGCGFPGHVAVGKSASFPCPQHIRHGERPEPGLNNRILLLFCVGRATARVETPDKQQHPRQAENHESCLERPDVNQLCGAGRRVLQHA